VHRSLIAPSALVAAALLALAPAGAAARRAPASAKPWATVNICAPAGAPGDVGVRAFMPLRGEAAQWARIRMQWWDASASRWRRVRSGGDGGWAKLGTGRRAVYGGTTFQFTLPDPGHRLVLRGIADLEWRSGRKVNAHARVRTTAGHASKKDRALKRSQAKCEIRR
jgi:hypothetical protein